MLTDQARQYIATLSEGELAEYIARGTEFYEADAILFAREELARRDIDPRAREYLQRTASEAAAADAARRAEAAALPLPRGEKITAFVVGLTWGLHHLPVGEWREYRRRGEDRRASEVWKFQWLGVATMVCVVLAVAGVIGYVNWRAAHAH